MQSSWQACRASSWVLRASSILPSGSRSDGFSKRAVGPVVQAEVGHEAVQEREDGRLLEELHVELLERLEKALRLDRVVVVRDLHRVEAEHRLEEAHADLAVDRRHDAARHARRVQGVHAPVLRHDHLVTALDAPDAARAGEHVVQVVDLVLGERRDLGLGGGRLGALLEVVAQLVARHLDARAVAHSRQDLHRRLDLPAAWGRDHAGLTSRRSPRCTRSWTHPSWRACSRPWSWARRRPGR